MARRMEASASARRPPRPSVPAFGGWDVGGAGAAAAAPDYSLDFTNIRAARMQRRTKSLSWSSFVDNNAAAAAEAPGGRGGGGGEDDNEEKRQWSSAATSDDDGDDGRERRHQLRRLRSAVDRLPIQPARAAPKGRGKFKGYLFGCVGGQW